MVEEVIQIFELKKARNTPKVHPFAPLAETKFKRHPNETQQTQTRMVSHILEQNGVACGT